MRKQVTRCGVSVLLLFLASTGRAATLSHPEVDSFNVAVGTQTFAGLYHLTTNTLLVETGEAIRSLGSDVINSTWGTTPHANTGSNYHQPSRTCDACAR
jgi:hypothetical protein